MLQTCTGSHVHLSIWNPSTHTHMHAHWHTPTHTHSSSLAAIILLHSHLQASNQVSKCISIHLFLSAFSICGFKKKRKTEGETQENWGKKSWNIGEKFLHSADMEQLLDPFSKWAARSPLGFHMVFIHLRFDWRSSHRALFFCCSLIGLD